MKTPDLTLFATLLCLAFAGCGQKDPAQAFADQWAEEEAADLERRLQEWEAAQPLLRAVKIKATKSDRGRITIEASNHGDKAFWGLTLRYIAHDPTRELPYETEDFLVFLDGGVEPGETKEMTGGFRPSEPYPTPAKTTLEVVAISRDLRHRIADGTMSVEDRLTALANRDR